MIPVCSWLVLSIVVCNAVFKEQERLNMHSFTQAAIIPEFIVPASVIIIATERGTNRADFDVRELGRCGWILVSNIIWIACRRPAWAPSNAWGRWICCIWVIRVEPVHMSQRIIPK